MSTNLENVTHIHPQTLSVAALRHGCAMVKSRPPALWLIACALLAPLLAMAVLPMTDNSEPRYAEIARLMAESNDWITPWFAPGVPFWGKPPLAFWFEALSIKALGVGEFALRLPSWLAWLATNAVLWAGVRRIHGAAVAHWAVLVYTTCALSSLCAGAVLTDPFLALGTTVSLVGFAVVVSDAGASIFWRYSFFLGLAIGLLAKGPLAVVLCGAPVCVWMLVQRGRRQATHWQRLPWLRGLALCALLSLPWYILAELKTPGFLHYFIVGEHFLRFVDTGWAGDRYGWAHDQPRGTIWLLWLLATFPWGIGCLGVLVVGFLRPQLRPQWRAWLAPIGRLPLAPLWLAAALIAPIFFTLAGNILWTYNLPAVAGLSVLIALGLDASAAHMGAVKRAVYRCAAIVPATVLVWVLIASVVPNVGKTERSLVQYAEQTDTNLPLYYLGDVPFSARFYSEEQAQSLSSTELAQHLHASRPFWLAVPKNQLENLQTQIGALAVYYHNKRYSLLRLPQ